MWQRWFTFLLQRSHFFSLMKRIIMTQTTTVVANEPDTSVFKPTSSFPFQQYPWLLLSFFFFILWKSFCFFFPLPQFFFFATSHNTASTPLHHTKWSPFFSLLNLSERRRSITHKNVENIVLPLRTVKSPSTKDKPIDMFQGHFWMLLCESMSPWKFRLVRIKKKKRERVLKWRGVTKCGN